MLDGLARLDPLLEKAKYLGMDSLAITDHGGLYGAIDFYQMANNKGIKPIIGCELYVAHGSRFDRNPSEKIHHLTVLAKNNKGYKNLVKLVTDANLEGYYKKPRADKELLEKYSEGLIVLSGCPSGEIPWLLAQERYDEAKSSAAWYRDVFKEDYFFEIMQHGDVPLLPLINKNLINLSNDLDLSIVGTNDSHYVNQTNARDHDILLCIQTNAKINDSKRMRFEEASYHLRSHDEMQKLFIELPSAISNTELIADMCDVHFDFTQVRLPEFTVPENMTSHEYLSKLCWDGYKHKIIEPNPEYEKRLEYELEVIKLTQFPDYFLVVWDIAVFVRKNNIFFTVRGSAAASLVLYCLGVTDIDPMLFKLVFERFLNIERKEMPDIDMDFQDDRRQEVINYCASRYGREHVAHIITFGRFGARQSIRDAGRALGMPLPNVDKIAKMIPEKLNITLSESLQESNDLNNAYNQLEDVKNLLDSAMQLEGVTRHKSLHAAGIVISKDPLTEVVPLEFTTRGDSNGAVMTQYAMEPVAALGLLKMDFLGLMNLTVLDETFKFILDNHGINIKLPEIPMDDTSTFDLLSRGETVGVFQLESAGMTRYIKELKPTSLGDVAAMIALFRPGPMDHITRFIEGKHGVREISYIHPAMQEILEETYGVIVYQDQVLHIVREFAGYSLGEADIVRKAMGKKVPEIMAEEKGKFMSGALRKGHTEELASSVFDLIEPFAGYAFNKAHSVSYGLVSYWTAYCKANYPVEYMCAFMNSYTDKKDRLVAAVADCRRMGIKVLPPDINNSMPKFSIEENEEGEQLIRFGLSAIKNVGMEGVKHFTDQRNENGKYVNLGMMSRNADMGQLNRKSLESLIMAGAFDAFGDRTGILDSIDRILSISQHESNIRNSTQTTMFEMLEDDSMPVSDIEIPISSTTDNQKRIWEVELMGISVSTSNHLSNLLSRVGAKVIVTLDQLEANTGNKNLKMAGQIATVVDRFTRDNRPFKVMTIEMVDGTIEAVVWEDTLNNTPNVWDPGRIVEFSGTVRERDNNVTININAGKELNVDDLLKRKQKNIMELNDKTSTNEQVNLSNDSSTYQGNSQSTIPSNLNRKKITLKIKETGDKLIDETLLDDLKRLLLSTNGKDEVALEIETAEAFFVLEWPLVKVSVSTELETDVAALLGESGSVSVQSLMF